MAQSFLSTYGTLVSLGGTVTVFLVTQALTKRRAAKALGYRVLSRERILSAAATEAGALKVLSGERRVYGIYVAKVQVVNYGTVAIKQVDIAAPIRINGPAGCQFLDAEVVATNRPGFTPATNLDPKWVEITPILINSGASLTVRILADNLWQDPTVTAYIEGTEEPRRLYAPTNKILDNALPIANWSQIINIALLLPVSLIASSLGRPIPYMFTMVNLLTVANAALLCIGLVRRRAINRSWEQEATEVSRIQMRKLNEDKERWALQDESSARQKAEWERQRAESKTAYQEELARINKEHREYLKSRHPEWEEAALDGRSEETKK